eukprot:5661-Heterococcus_DN1.PRE.9
MAASTYWQPVVFGFIVAVIKLSVLHTFQTCKCIVVVVCYSHIAQAADLSSNTFKSYTQYPVAQQDLPNMPLHSFSARCHCQPHSLLAYLDRISFLL